MAITSQEVNFIKQRCAEIYQAHKGSPGVFTLDAPDLNESLHLDLQENFDVSISGNVMVLVNPALDIEYHHYEVPPRRKVTLTLTL